MCLPEYKNLLIIGSNTRKSGKTSLLCKILEMFSSEISIVGVKIAVDESLSNFKMQTEKEITDVNNDTQRMLKAGGQKAFYIKTNSNEIGIAFNKLIEEIGNQFFIVCESLSLRKYIDPSIFIAIENNNGSSKTNFNELKQYADLLVYSHEVEKFDLKNIFIENGSWMLK